MGGAANARRGPRTPQRRICGVGADRQVVRGEGAVDGTRPHIRPAAGWPCRRPASEQLPEPTLHGFLHFVGDLADGGTGDVTLSRIPSPDGLGYVWPTTVRSDL
jgi:hypothetical protein